MLVLTQPQDLCTQQGTTSQVKGALRLGGRQTTSFCPALRFRLGGQIRHWQRQTEIRSDDLHRLSLHHGKAGSQAFVASGDLVEALLQYCQLKGSAQAYSNGNSVQGTLGFPLIEEP